MLLDIYKKKSKFFIYVFLFFAGFYFVFLTNCAYCQKGLNASYENDLAYIQVVKESVDSLQNFLILLDKNIVKENEQINNFSLDIALQQLEIINKELLAIKKEDFYCQNLIKSFFSLCNLVKSIKILKFSDKQKILKAINIIKKDYICSDNLQSNYIKQKTDFLIENIVSLSDLIRSVFLTQKIELKGLGSKIFDKFIYKPCRFIVDNKKNVIIITCAIGSLIISGALINKFLKKEEVDSNSNNNLGVDSKQDQIGHDIEHDSDEQKGESDEQKKGIKLKLTTQKEFKLRSKFWTQEEQVKILAKYDTSEHDKIRKIFLEKEQEEKSISDRLNKNNNNNTTNKENMAEAKMGRWARFKTGVKNGVKKCFSGFAVNSQQKAETKFPGSCGIDMNLKK